MTLRKKKRGEGLRNTNHYFIPCLPAFHLRDVPNNNKKKAFNDLKKILDLLKKNCIKKKKLPLKKKKKKKKPLKTTNH
jgi:hypothetical protein